MVVALDVGGTRIKAALVTDEGKMVDSIILPTEAHRGREYVLDKVVDLIRWGLDRGAKGAGLAVASPLDPERGVLYEPPNLPGFGVFLLKDYLEDRLSFPVIIENDANAYFLGEWWLGAGKGSRVLLGVTLGTGVGGALVVDGSVWHGAHGLGGEFGHVIVLPDGPKCNCGNRGCFEAVASSKYLKELYKKLSGAESDPEGIYKKALAGDRAALEAFRMLARNLGLALAGLANALDPDRVVIGGGLANAGMLLLEGVKIHFYSHVLPGVRERVEICLASLGDFSAVLGAAYIAIQSLNGGEA